MTLGDLIALLLSGEKRFTPEGRQMFARGDGSIATELQATVPFQGGWHNAPSLYQGRRYTDDEILELMQRTGWQDPDTGASRGQRYSTMAEAIAAAIAHSNAIDPTNTRTSGRHPSLGR